MMNLKQIALPALLLAALMLFGCIDQEYYNRAVAGSGVVIDGAGSEDLCAQGNCNCMVCDTFPNPEDDPATKFYPFSYWASTCYYKSCSFDDYQRYLEATPIPGDAPRSASGRDMLNYFMFGQGGFGEFNRANTFCNNSLRMPVKWLDSRNGLGKYPLPDPDRALCFVDKGTIPLYILYSRGEAIDPARSAEIAGLFEESSVHTGPVILTSELEFDSTDPTAVSNVREQVIAMKQACQGCQIALAPRLGDNSTALERLMADPLVNSSVDLFAFGVDSNNYTSCSPLLMLSDAMQYSQYLLYKYKKPSVLAYVLFDNTTSSDGSCTWDDSLVSEGYSAFYTYPQGFASSGIIGGALYSLYGVADPLGCTDCGLYNSSGDPIPQRQASWFSGCQGAYATSSVVPLVFSDSPGTSCSYSQPGYSFVGLDLNTVPPTYTEPAGSWEPFYSCDSCLVEKAPSSIKISASIPANPVRGRDGREMDICTDFPALDVYADIRDLDPAYVRTMALWETGFDECSVGTSSEPCGRNTEVYTIEDPLGNCPTYTTEVARQRAGEHSCDMGLIPVFAPPQQYWDGIDFLEFMEDEDGELAIARECRGDEAFNPFLPEHNICLATYEMAGHIRTAEDRVENNAAAIGLTEMGSPGDENYENAKGLFTLFFARMEFIAPKVWSLYGRAWLSGFREFSNVDCSENSEHACCSGDHLNSNLVSEGCCGPSADFINFVSNEECMEANKIVTEYKTPVSRIKRFLSMYLGVREKCGICDQESWDENVNAWASTTTGG
ncbi:MAG: hypothetical protein WC350_00595 [Candidatus Micrarchaeia archaeon]|jgi:hypothetical protein